MPDWRSEIRARLANAHIDPANEAEIVEELAQHLDDEFAELRARGHDAMTARQNVLAQLNEPDFPSALLNRERARPGSAPVSIGASPTVGGWFASVWQDVRYGLRALSRSPVFTIVAVVSLAVGIGATTAIFGLVNAVLLERLAVRHPEELVQVRRSNGKGIVDRFTYSDYSALKQAPNAPRLVATASSGVTVMAGTTREYPNVDAVSGDFFEMLGIRPLIGRTITVDDDRSGAMVVVVSQRFWERQLGADPSALGHSLRINDEQFTIVGVLPRTYRGLLFEGTFTLAVPISVVTRLGMADLRAPRPTLVNMFARTTPGLDAERLGRVVDDAFQRCCESASAHLIAIDASHGTTNPKIDLRGEYGRILTALMAGVLLLLLIVCANVGSLLLARASARRRELAVRMSMGATRSRIARQLLTESLELGLAGGVLGLVLARLGTILLSHNLPPVAINLADAITLRPSATILIFTAATTIACTLFFGVLPAIRAARVDVMTPLKDGGRTTRGGRDVIDRGIVVTQVALALVLVCAATLFVTTLRNLERFDEAKGVSEVLLVGVDTRGTEYATRGMRPLAPDLLTALRGIPGVTSAAISSSVPVFGGRTMRDAIHVPGFEPRVDEDQSAWFAAVSPDFFATTGIGIERGRAFDARDVAGAERVAIVTRAFVKHFFAGRDPIGGSIVLGEGAEATSMRIVGVARDARYTDLRAPAPELYYAPLAQAVEIPVLVLSIRSRTDVNTLAPMVRREVERIAPGLRVSRLNSFEHALNEELARERLAAGLATLFGLLALGLAAIGIYGVVAYNVARRTAEIGVRMALGARPADAVWLVVRQTMTMTAIGVAIGAPLAVVAARMIGTQLYGIGATDPRALLGAVGILGVAGALASVVPGRRAANVDPVEALRGE